MSNRLIVAAALVALIGVGVFLALTTRGPGPFAPDNARENVAVPSVSAPALPPAADAGAAQERLARLRATARRDMDAAAPVAEFFAAPSAPEALAALEGAGLDEDTNLALTKALADACPPGGHGAGSERQQWFADRLDRYCDGFSFDADEYEALQQRFSRATRLAAGTLAGEIANMTMAEQEAFLRDAIADATSWSDLETIKVVLDTAYHLAPARDRASPDALHRLGQDPGYTGEQGQRIHRNALTLLQCVDYVSCGPDSVVTLNQCYANPVCEPGWSIYDLFYNTSSPLEDEQVLAVLQTLLELRGGG